MDKYKTDLKQSVLLSAAEKAGGLLGGGILGQRHGWRGASVEAYDDDNGGGGSGDGNKDITMPPRIRPPPRKRKSRGGALWEGLTRGGSFETKKPLHSGPASGGGGPYKGGPY